MSTCPYCTGRSPPDVAVCPICGRNLRPAGTGAIAQKKKRGLRRVLPYVITPLLGLALCAGVLYPFVQQAREAGRRTSCNCNIKVLGLALHNYHDAYGCFPPAYIADSQGRPMHSWRVLILPYIGEEDLYARYKFDEPWDGPNNIKLLDEIPPNFKCPSHVPRPPETAVLASSFGHIACSTLSTVSSAARRRCTNYAAALGPHCVFRGADPVSIKDVTDGLSKTVMIGEVTDADILWTKPEEMDIAKHPKIGDRMGFSSDHESRIQFLFGDGHVESVGENVSQKTVDALYTRDGGERVGDY
jgi:prepilin-type processing-associated H-X9-DG protein